MPEPYDLEPAPIGRYLSLGDLIRRLEREDPDRLLQLGFANPHSYRGDYMDLAFEPVRRIAIGAMLDAARSALGATFQGYKGGDYVMGEYTTCWLARYGESSNNMLGPLLLEFLLHTDFDACNAVIEAANLSEEASADGQ